MMGIPAVLLPAAKHVVASESKGRIPYMHVKMQTSNLIWRKRTCSILDASYTAFRRSCQQNLIALLLVLAGRSKLCFPDLAKHQCFIVATVKLCLFRSFRHLYQNKLQAHAWRQSGEQRMLCLALISHCPTAIWYRPGPTNTNSRFS